MLNSDMPLLFVPGRVPYDYVRTLHHGICQSSLIALGRQVKGGWSQFPGNHFTFDQILQPASRYRDHPVDDCLLGFFHQIVSDPRTGLIMERCLKHTAWYSSFESWRIVFDRIHALVGFLRDTVPSAVLFQATPHGDWEWLLGKVAECMSLPVYVFKTSPLPWRYCLVKGIDQQEIQPPIQALDSVLDFAYPNQAEDEKKLLQRFLSVNQGNYKAALPEYERARLSARRGKIWSWRKELRDLVRYPSNATNLYRKYTLYREYVKHSEKFQADMNCKNIVLFLHYQPERTSLPEGNLWCQQWIVAKTISDALPSGWKLRVKEHPSSMMGDFISGYRSPQFYRELAQLKNVELVPLDSDTFDLIDASAGIATITGTVGVQALIRGKPVLAFGVPSYSQAEGVTTISDVTDLRRAVEKIASSSTPSPPTRNHDEAAYWSQVMEQSVTGRTHLDYSDPIVWHSPDVRFRGHARLLAALLSNSFQSIMATSRVG